MKKYGYPLAAAFVLFLIFTAPETSGASANGFVEFISTLFSAFGQFLEGLFGGVSNG